ncbi:hypothetical protein OK016_13855 [Vibrio chagasii]|nr:hypothetical protein [Vibrio chagasii]
MSIQFPGVELRRSSADGEAANITMTTTSISFWYRTYIRSLKVVRK